MSLGKEKENKRERWLNIVKQEWSLIGFIKNGYLFRWHDFQYFLWVEEKGS